jgi:signal transduction histidine kinase/CheY-like chemotaxis protein
VCVTRREALIPRTIPAVLISGALTLLRHTRPMTAAPDPMPDANSVLDALSELVVVRGPDGRVVRVNAAFLAAFGGRAADWAGRWFAVGPGLGASGQARRFDAAMQTRSGSRFIEWSETPLPGGGAVALGRDVTAERQARMAASEAARGKTVFFASVTHELRTPLAGALGAADLLRDTKLKPDQHAYLDALRSSTEHALKLIDDILDLSRLEAGQLALRPEPVDLRALVEDTSELLALRAAQKGLTLDHVIHPGVPERLSLDPARVRQILFNLAGNAVKFTASGGVLVEADYADGAVRLSVRDTGPGIGEADQARLFEQFERGAQEGSGAPGAGLGLAMVRRLVQAAGGDVGVESRLGEGAVFWCAWPCEPLKSAPAVRPLRGRTVLIAVPSALQREALAAQAQALGARVMFAGEPREAMRLAARVRESLTVILSERWAPEARAVKAAAPCARLLALARPQTKDLLSAAARPSGFDGWLVAPVRLASLAAFAADDQAPRVKAHTPEPPPVPAPPPVHRPGAEAPLKGLSVILAEDDPVNALIARKVLGRLGAEVLHVADGQAAVEAAACGVYDAAFLDLRMPVMGGLTAARAIRALAGARARLPLIALTANATETDRQAALAAGMDAFLTKPLNADLLAGTLTGLCAPQNRARLA